MSTIKIMKTQIQTLKGFRDFLPAQKRVRDFAAKKITETFERFGFEPLETPTLEYAELLTGKYGDEADKLVYIFEDKGGRQVGLRYDQTVPTARVLSHYQSELPPFFRRYQIQNVFRADKPQKGRFREFTQCDADIFNAPEPIADAEILAVFFALFNSIGIKDIHILINDRQSLMQAVSPFVTSEVAPTSIIQSLDKLDKLSQDQVEAELTAKGLEPSQAKQVIATLNSTPPPSSLQAIQQTALDLGVSENNLVYSPTLARGLDYYTGLIFEAVLPGLPGSLGAGGRYDNLIEQLGGPPTPAVGFGLGFDRTVEAAQSLNLVPQANQGTQLLITVFDSSTLPYSLKVANQMRQSGIRTEVYPTFDKLPKQLKLANKKQIPFVAILGPEEAANQTITIKNMQTGTQQIVSPQEAITLL